MVSIRCAYIFFAIFAVSIAGVGAEEVEIDNQGGARRRRGFGLKSLFNRARATVRGVADRIRGVKEGVKDRVEDRVEGVKDRVEGVKDRVESAADRARRIAATIRRVRETIGGLREELRGFKCPVKIRDSVEAVEDADEADAHGLGWVLGKLGNIFERIIGIIANRRNDEEEGALNSLKMFGAELDTVLDKPLQLRTSKLVRQRALTAKNVTHYSTDVAEFIKESPNYVHEFFPQLTTRGFDPTLHLDEHSDQIPGIRNRIAACLFSLPENVLSKLVEILFHRIVEEPSEQGVWTDDIPGHSSELGVMNKDLEIVQNLGSRFDWKMNSYFDKTFDVTGANQDISKRFLYRWPNPSTEPFNDELFAQFYFASFAQSFVRRVNPDIDTLADGATYVAALDYASTLAVKPGTGKYGGDVFFDEQARLMHIVYDGRTYRKGDTTVGNWENLKTRCRGTAAMIMTSINHLLGVHLHFSNSLSMAVPLLPPTHKLRQLLWPHIFNAVGVNRKAFASLSVDGGLFTRGWGLNLTGVHQAFDFHKANNPFFRWHTPPEFQQTVGIDDSLKMPLYEDGIDFYNICRDYVQRYVALYYANDEAVANDADIQAFHDNLNEHLVNNDLTPLTSVEALVDVVATYIYYVTGYHTHAGNLHLSVTQSGIAPGLWYEDGNLDSSTAPPNADMWETITFIGTASLTLPITGDSCSTEQKCGFAEKKSYQNPAPNDAVHQPPIQPIGYPDFFETEKEKAINKRFVVDLLALQSKIVQRNKLRHACQGGRVNAVCRVFNTFDVNWVEMSVGI